MYNIVLGRNATDLKQFGEQGTILLGKHYVTMGKEKSLANPILLDVNRPHVILVSGKRGSGKSYTLGVMAEGLADLPRDIAENIGCLIFDTMGIYWTMKHANYRDDSLLHEWKLKPRKMDPKIFVPETLLEDYKDKGFPVDYGLSISISDLEAEDWATIFNIELNSNPGILVERIILGLKEQGKVYDFDVIIKAIDNDDRSTDEEKNLVAARFEAVRKWGLFNKKGSSLSQIIKGGQLTIIDLSAYSQIEDGELIKSLVIGLISKMILKQRLQARRLEELKEIREETFKKGESREPLVWVLIDEAHEFLPKDGSTLATFPLVQLLREGRQPGISLVLATQQPGKLHTDVLTQADIVFSHRLTAKLDVTALNDIMQSYLPLAIQQYIDGLPKEKGTAIVLDDNSEKIYPMRVRPRFSWHGGEDPKAIQKLTRGKKLDLGL